MFSRRLTGRLRGVIEASGRLFRNAEACGKWVRLEPENRLSGDAFRSRFAPSWVRFAPRMESCSGGFRPGHRKRGGGRWSIGPLGSAEGVTPYALPASRGCQYSTYKTIYYDRVPHKCRIVRRFSQVVENNQNTVPLDRDRQGRGTGQWQRRWRVLRRRGCGWRACRSGCGSAGNFFLR